MKSALLLLLLSTPALAQITFPIQPGTNGHYLTDATGKPVYLCGDTPWQLIVDLKRDEVIRYLDARKAQGYNTLLIDLLSEEKIKKQAQCQCEPFGQRDFADINTAYFDHAEWVLETARQKGFVVLCTVAYWGCCNPAEGWSNELIPTPTEVLRRYGQYIGQRFARFNNVIWTLGGDSSRGKEKFEAMQAGIRDRHPQAQFTYHTREDELATEHYPDLTFDGVYAYTSDRVYRLTDRGYQRPNPLPLIYTEGFYDQLIGSNFHGWTWTPTLQSRYLYHQMYSFLLSGGLGGFINGDFKLWSFPADWPRHLNAPNQPAMTLFYQFVNSLKWWTLEPDHQQTLIGAGRGRYGDRDYITAALSRADGQLIVFVPNFAEAPTRTFTVNFSQFRPTVGYWMNPADGQQQPIQSLPTNGSFTTPAGVSTGWVLVLKQ